MGLQKTIFVILRRLSMLVAFVVIFTVSAATVYYFSRGKEVVVPNMVGKTEREVTDIATRVGLKIETIDIFDSAEAIDKVTRQYPKAGAVVRKGFTIKVNINRAEASWNTNTPEFIDEDPPLDLTPWGDDLCGILIMENYFYILHPYSHKITVI